MAILGFDPRPQVRKMRVFGVSLLVTAGLLAGLTAFVWGNPVAGWSVAGFLGLVSLVAVAAPSSAPARLGYLVVSYPGFLVGNLVSLVVLTLFFYLIFSPIAALVRLFRPGKATGGGWQPLSPERDSAHEHLF